MPGALAPKTPAASQLDEDGRKRFSTLQARAALAGHALTCTSEDGREMFLANRWARTREFANLDEVEAWLRQVEGVARSD